MNPEEFIVNFANQFDDTDVSLFELETKFRDIDEWSSLTALLVMAMVDEEYDVILSANEMEKSNTIQDIYDIVKARI